MRGEKESLPEDLKAIIAHNLIQLTFGMEDYLLDPYERVVVYNHAFPTPKKQFLHTTCLLYTSPSPRDATLSRMPSSA